MWILTGLCLILLVICTYTDIRSREIFWPLPAFYFFFALLYRGVTGTAWYGVTELVLRLVPGILLLLIGLVKRKWIGIGDGLLVLCIGYALGAQAMTTLLFAASFFGAAYAGILLLLKKRRQKDTIPFAPFLLAGCVVWILTYMMGDH